METVPLVQTELIKPHCSWGDKAPRSASIRLSLSSCSFKRCSGSSLYYSWQFVYVWFEAFISYSVLQLPSVSSAHFSDLELTTACLDIKQIQTLGAVAAAALSRSGIIWKITIQAFITALKSDTDTKAQLHLIIIHVRYLFLRYKIQTWCNIHNMNINYKVVQIG